MDLLLCIFVICFPTVNSVREVLFSEHVLVLLVDIMDFIIIIIVLKIKSKILSKVLGASSTSH